MSYGRQSAFFLYIFFWLTHREKGVEVLLFCARVIYCVYFFGEEEFFYTFVTNMGYWLPVGNAEAGRRLNDSKKNNKKQII